MIPIARRNGKVLSIGAKYEDKGELYIGDTRATVADLRRFGLGTTEALDARLIEHGVPSRQ